MSALLDEIIALRKAKAIEYEEFLRRIADVAARVQAGKAADTPQQLDTPGKRALYNNLKEASDIAVVRRAAVSDHAMAATGDTNLDLAIQIDWLVRAVKHDGWRGVAVKESIIKAKLHRELGDVDEVERIFRIIFAQKEY